MAEAQPSGVRLVFRTRATCVRLETVPTKQVYVGAPPRPDGVYELVIDGRVAARATASGGDTMTIDLATGSVEHAPAIGVRRVRRASRRRQGRRALAAVERADRARGPLDRRPRRAPDEVGRARWVHHGSSISHGSNAAGPTTTWPAIAAFAGRVDLVNLGFAGSGLLDPFVARVIRDAQRRPDQPRSGSTWSTPTSCAGEPSCRRCTGSSTPSARDTRRRRCWSSRRSRARSTRRPRAPVSWTRPAWRGPASLPSRGDPAEVASGKLTLQVIRDELASIVRQRAAYDAHLGYLDGLELTASPMRRRIPFPTTCTRTPRANSRSASVRLGWSSRGDGLVAP